MKTKFKKVSVSERLPEKEGWQIVERENTNVVSSYFHGQIQKFSHDDANYWLEEVPDMEEEMRDLIERFVAITALGEKAPDYLVHDGENLLTKLKQQS
ncbi:hypothetical protein EG359_17315 [Chryseobacterium joostei]|uniref:Uncharacterized protein n=1 Tax=Chryseobacterium joostei TaxID=112234 RepID=A0A1N7IB16_9FLAO|nr:hypothetical protein [Chryseobacterium joostei]AZB01263.1 hypothetical protein EG359_17315 [Chryseobacterium joostei]SIS34247.1 hypothetical protein SAMN05421768_103662 [Chryseobacterium joostei]